VTSARRAEEHAAQRLSRASGAEEHGTGERDIRSIFASSLQQRTDKGARGVAH
jgi:hypothetical protein